MVEALLNRPSAELTPAHAALKEVHAQPQVTGKVIHDVKDNVAIVKGAMNTAQGGTTGVQPVTAQPAAAPQVQKAQFKTPPKPQPVSPRCGRLACTDRSVSAGCTGHASKAESVILSVSNCSYC